MKFLCVTVQSDNLNITQMKNDLGNFGTFYKKDEPVFNKYSGKEMKTVQPTNRWCYSCETKSRNINLSLSSFIQRLLDNKNLLPYLTRYGAIVEITVYYTDNRSRHMLTISNQNLQRLASINAKLQITVVDF